MYRRRKEQKQNIKPLWSNPHLLVCLLALSLYELFVLSACILILIILDTAYIERVIHCVYISQEHTNNSFLIHY